MKNVKTLAAIAAMALMALAGAGTASAKEGVLCSTATDPCTSKWAVGTVLDWSLEPGTSFSKTNTEGTTQETCTEATIQFKLTANPDATGTATGENTAITLGKCTFNDKTTKLGKLKIESEGNGNGIIYSDEEIKITTSIFGSCEYGVTAGTTLGTVKEGGTITINAIASRLNACLGPATDKWAATFTLTQPTSTTFYVSHK